MPTVLKGHAALIYYSVEPTPGGGSFPAPTLIGYTESLSVDFGRNVDPFYQHGDHQPVDLVEGNEEINGSISRAFINWDLLDAILVSGTNGILPEVMLYVAAKVYPSGFKYLYLYNCKFGDSSLDFPQDGFLMQDVDFIARTWGAVTPA